MFSLLVFCAACLASVNCEGLKSDTLVYRGFIAVEMLNKMKYWAKRKDDPINIYNVTNCRGFVLCDKKVIKMDFEKAFFPLSLCDNQIDKETFFANNDRFYDTIFNKINRRNVNSYQKVITVKGQGKLYLNYKLLKVRLKYTIVRNAVLKKYTVWNGIDNSLDIHSNLCKIIELNIE